VNSLGSGKAKYKLIDTILGARNNGKYIAGVLCGLTKALNSVNHELLFKKLEFYGV
jgi:hypothetical protein